MTAKEPGDGMDDAIHTWRRELQALVESAAADLRLSARISAEDIADLIEMLWPELLRHNSIKPSTSRTADAHDEHLHGLEERMPEKTA